MDSPPALVFPHASFVTKLTDKLGAVRKHFDKVFCVGITHMCFGFHYAKAAVGG